MSAHFARRAGAWSRPRSGYSELPDHGKQGSSPWMARAESLKVAQVGNGSSDEQALVESLSYGGDGVARLGGKVAFVPLAAPGDVLRLVTRERRKSYLRADIEQIVRSGAARREPACPLFGRCGGCQWQHVNYDAQLEAKRSILVHALRDLPLRIGELVAAPAELGYRRRVRAHWRVRGARVELGFFRAGSRRVVDAERCMLCVPELARAWDVLRERLGAVVDGSGTLVLLAGHGRDVHASLRIDRGRLRGDLNALLCDALAGVVARDAGGSVTRAGREDVELDERGVRGSADAFAQASALQDAAVRRHVSALVPPDCDNLLELFAGVGNLTAAVMSAQRRVVAVESHPVSVQLLRRNAARFSGQLEVMQADAARAVRELRRGESFDAVLLDPPREGARDVIDSLVAMAPKVVIYVSCDPMTLARDLRQLCAAGYGDGVAIGVDMMPQTFHFETVVRVAA